MICLLWKFFPGAPVEFAAPEDAADPSSAAMLLVEERNASRKALVAHVALLQPLAEAQDVGAVDFAGQGPPTAGLERQIRVGQVAYGLLESAAPGVGV